MIPSESPKVTVLLPVFNAAEFLSTAIDSILAQTFVDFELLIIDDGSSDGSDGVVESYVDPRINFIRNGTNLGLVATLNKGLQVAKGEYIARMDADDISLPERLACQVGFMDANQAVGVCGSWVHLFSDTDKSVWKLPDTSEKIRCWQFHTVGVAHPSVIIRRKLFVQHGLLYDPHYSHIEDYELWGRAIKYMDFANIQKVLVEYRISDGQICARYGAEQLAAVAPLRRRRVAELGIEPTQEEQELHEMILNGALPPEQSNFDRAERWLLRLEAANRAAAVYDADYFSRRLVDIWFSVSLSCTDGTWNSLLRCLRSPLWHAAGASIWRRICAMWVWACRGRSVRELKRA